MACFKKIRKVKLPYWAFFENPGKQIKPTNQKTASNSNRICFLKVCVVLLMCSSLSEVIHSGVAGCHTANLGPQPRGLAWSDNSSQHPTTIVCVFVYEEICHANPSRRRLDSACKDFCLFVYSFLFERDLTGKTSASTLWVSCSKSWSPLCACTLGAAKKKKKKLTCMYEKLEVESSVHSGANI